MHNMIKKFLLRKFYANSMANLPFIITDEARLCKGVK